MAARKNWAGNVAFSAVAYAEPSTVEELQRIVRGAPSCRVVGTRHSFSDVADTRGVLVDLARMPSSVVVDERRGEVTCAAGITFGQLGAALHGRGLAIANVPSLPHISLAGALCTATHGSGTANPCLASLVRGCTFVAADGALCSVTAGDMLLQGVMLGALGPLVQVTLQAEPSFDVAQMVYGPLPWAAVGTADALWAVLSAAYSVSLFTDHGSGGCHQVWVKRRVGSDDDAAAAAFAARRWTLPHARSREVFLDRGTSACSTSARTRPPARRDRSCSPSSSWTEPTGPRLWRRCAARDTPSPPTSA